MADEEPNRWLERLREDITNLDENRKIADDVGKNCSIYRIRAHMSTSKTHNNYKPQLLSLGPYHHGQEHLKQMEEEKEQALVQLLHESQIDIRYLIACLKPHERALMDAYENLNEEWRKKDGKFLKMLILDGCFFIAILKQNFSQYSKDNIIFSKTSLPMVIQLIRRDMLLLENQLPFLLVKKLMTEFKIDDVEDLIERFFFPAFGTRLKVKLGDSNNHLLDIIRLAMLHEIPRAQAEDMHRSGGGDSSRDGNGSSDGSLGDGGGHEGPSGGGASLFWGVTIFQRAHTPSNDGYPSNDGGQSTPIIKNSPSATMLYHSNIKFMRSTSDSFMGAMLDKYTAHLPAIVIGQYSEAFFSNLIAFEQLHFSVRPIMSSFFLLMAGLLVIPEDVRLLRDSGIIESFAMSDTAVIEIIQNIIEGLSFSKDDEIFRLQQQLNDSFVTNKRSWRRKINTWLSKLNENYLDSPWSIMGVFKTTIWIAATVGTTYYTYESYKLSYLVSLLLFSHLLYKFKAV